MTMDILLALTLFAFVSVITPGPNNIMLMSSGANFGFTRSLPHMFGVGLGFSLMVVLVGIGIMTLFELLPASYQVLKVVSIAYLVYLAFKIATAAGPQGNMDASQAKPFTFVQAALFQWVNPKAWTMALTSISVYAPSRSYLAVLLVALIYVLVSVVSTSSWVLVGQSLKAWLNHALRLKIFNLLMAGLLLASLYPAIQ